MARRQPAQHGPAAAVLDVDVKVDLTAPDIFGAIRLGMLDGLIETQREVRTQLAAFTHGHGDGRRGLGHAAQTLRSKLFRGPRGFLGVTGWGPRQFYMHILEHGAVAHFIASRESEVTHGRRNLLTRVKALKIQTSGGLVFRRSAHHPGIRPRPILATAAANVEPRIVALINQRIANALEIRRGPNV